MQIQSVLSCAFRFTVRYSMLVFDITLLLSIIMNRTLYDTTHKHTHYLTRTANYTVECVSIFNVMNTSSSMLRTKFIQNSKQTTLLFVDQNKLDGLCLELFKTRTQTHTFTHLYIQTHTNSFALHTERER